MSTNKKLKNEKVKAPKNIIGPTTGGAMGQYILGQLSEFSKFAKVDKPLNKPKGGKAEKDYGKKKGIKIVDAAGRGEDDDDEGGGGVQGLFESQTFTDDQIKEAFFTFDMNGNGYIGVAEIRFVLDALGEDVTDEEIDEMIRMLDVDGDGQVNFKEFFKMASGQSLAPIGVALPPPRDMNIA